MQNGVKHQRVKKAMPFGKSNEFGFLHGITTTSAASTVFLVAFLGFSFASCFVPLYNLV